MQTLILGDGPMGRAVATAFGERRERAAVVGRPIGPRHDPTVFRDVDLVVDASAGGAVASNIAAALDAGVRRFVIAATGWTVDRADVGATLGRHGAAAVVGANYSLGVALFARLVDAATDLFGSLEAFDPYLVEWHRRSKADRPSGTALELGRRIVDHHPRLTDVSDLETVSIRAGASPGMHLVGFDAVGETVELRITARDRAAYAAGVLASAAWLRRAPRAAGIHPFDLVVDDLLARATDVAA
jgi:4-hydroxy-tetrahydrodipicolinate reductase